jgi:hypothetical protein
VQREFAYRRPVPAGQPTLTGMPDFAIRQGGQVRCVLDAKWKTLDGPPMAADVHQALVYPGRRYQAWRYEMTKHDTALTVHTIRIVEPREMCDRSVRRLLRSLSETLLQSDTGGILGGSAEKGAHP